MILGYPHGEVYWRKKSSVGYKVAKKLREALLQHGWMTHKADATINLHDGSGNCNGYLIADFVPSRLDGLSFQSTRMVYAASTSSKKTKLNVPEVDIRMKALWDLWELSPLIYNNQKMFTASRRFNNADLTRGGRMYGQWTGMKKPERLKCTIDDKPVAEVDVSGMNLTLLCSISGEVPFTKTFEDAYACGWNNRADIKAIINETIGSGTPRHYVPAKLCWDVGLDQQRFTHIRKTYITPKFRCLQMLKKGVMDSLTLAYHETEIMMRVVERLQKPIFILHDCLICQQDVALNIGKELQREYVSYCKEQGWTIIEPAFKIDVHNRDTSYVCGRVI
jgi:hypothetical protein